MALQIGDKVAYSAAYLQSTGQYTGDVPFARGVVTGFEKLGFTMRVARVAWDCEDCAGRVIETNLAKVGSRAMSAD